MKSLSKLVAVITVSSVLACTPALKKGPEFSYYQENPTSFRLVEIMSGKDNDERLKLLTDALENSDIPYHLDPFKIDGNGGTNVFADLGNGPHTLVVAAHYDRRAATPGANDNASCVAAALSAYKKLQASSPLENIRVRFLFPDKEEIGLIGTKGYIKNYGVENVVGMVSFDMCGIGDAFGIWDVTDDLENSLIVRSLQNAGEIEGIYNGTHGPVPRNSSDHAQFYLNGVPAVGVTVLPKSDEAVLRDYIRNPNAFKWLRVSNRPVIFQTYHTARDLPETIDPAALEMTSRLMVSTVKEFDRLVGE